MTRVVSFPHMGDYAAAIRPLGDLLGEVLLPPPITSATLELGARHSPEAVCVPFKYTLGCFIEALERGADTLAMTGGGCRLGFYAEVQEAILHDLGYEFELIALSNHTTSLRQLMTEFRRLNPANSRRTIARTFALAAKRIAVLDQVQAIQRRDAAFACDKTAYRALGEAFLSALSETKTPADAEAVGREYGALLESAPMARPERPLRIGVVGEIYVAMEPFSNQMLERMLAELGAEVRREVTVSGVLDGAYGGRAYLRELVASASPYLKHDIGMDGTKSVAHALTYLREGFDGVIHVKPFGCLPEVNALPALQRLSREHDFPLMTLSFDVHTSETGTRTRVEAFCDMLLRRREGRRPD
jgi:predicted nucleotide-binding protein (sugar kinase/HSP70/actin superfamily)